jgi:hypothetical protein
LSASAVAAGHFTAPRADTAESTRTIDVAEPSSPLKKSSATFRAQADSAFAIRRNEAPSWPDAETWKLKSSLTKIIRLRFAIR